MQSWTSHSAEGMPFWIRRCSAFDGMAAPANVNEFFKNLGMMGGLLMIVVDGTGAWSLDRVLRGGEADARRPDSEMTQRSSPQ